MEFHDRHPSRALLRPGPAAWIDCSYRPNLTPGSVETCEGIEGVFTIPVGELLPAN